MNYRKTKLELSQDNQRLALENAELRKLVGDLEFEVKRLKVVAANTGEPTDSGHSYPYTDGLGRRYRLDGRVRCFEPAKH